MSRVEMLKNNESTLNSLVSELSEIMKEYEEESKKINFLDLKEMLQ
jgi:hypothetical protein